MVKLRSPEFHDAYIERENLLYYQHHGDFPEGTALVKEIVLTQKRTGCRA
jgi:hypothetical protein